MAAQGSVLTNKYAEGYPGKRYYGGCEYVDVAENLAIERAKELFGAVYANVQPHSGSQANMAVYFSLLNPGDTVLGMNLSHGGHLTHGSPVNFSGKLFSFVHYGVNPDTETIDYDELARIAEKNKPKLLIAGASAYREFWILSVCPNRRIRGCLSDGRYGSYRRIGGCGRSSITDSPRACGYFHNPQDIEGPSWRIDRIRSGFQQTAQQRDIPRNTGRAVDARYCRQGRCF
jgi:hypothetical protein